MTAPISRIGGQRVITRDSGSDGHDAVSKKLDSPDSKAVATAHPRNKKVDEVAKMYERQFLGEMFKAMRSTINETDKPSMAQGIYNSQRDEQYIDAWSEQGGVGFSNIIYDQIMDRFFGGTQQGQAMKKQGMIALTNRDITNVSKVENGVATPVVPKAAKLEPLQKVEARTVENTEPMPAPTAAPIADVRSREERLAAGELFPPSATAKPVNTNVSVEPSQTSLKIEVRPSLTGQPAKIQAPWDAVVVRSVKLVDARTAVTLEHGEGIRSTLVFDGVLSSQTQTGQKIPRGEAIGTLSADAKSFLWNLATPGSTGGSSRSASETSQQ